MADDIITCQVFNNFKIIAQTLVFDIKFYFQKNFVN
jgi:hypothetical protein